jgi:hypothetical protein
MYYEHALAHEAGKEVCYDEEPDILDMEGVRKDEHGNRIYSK